MKAIDWQCVALGGLPGSGKTFILQSILKASQNEKQSVVACKPFDTNQKAILQKDEISDAEKLSCLIANNPRISVITTYATYSDAYLQLGLTKEGVIPKKEKVYASMQKLQEHFSICWIEMPKYAYMPIYKGEYAAAWIKEYTKELIYIVPLQQYPLELILAEIEAYKQQGFTVRLVMNNLQPLKQVQDCYEWWQTIEEATNVFFIDMLPYVKTGSTEGNRLFSRKIEALLQQI